MDYTIKSGDMSFTVSTLGAELISAKNQNGDEFIWQANPDFWGDHAPLLFPVCGRLKNFYYTYEGKRYDMGIHGFLRRLEFDVVAAVDTIVLKDVGTHSRLICEKSSHEIEMHFSENLPLYCIWKHPSMDAHYLCLEPWTTEPARYVEEEHLTTRENMIHLAPRASEHFFCDFTFKR